MAGGGAPGSAAATGPAAHTTGGGWPRSGSVAAGVLDDIGLQRLLDKREQLSFQERNGAFAWHLPVPDAEVTPRPECAGCSAAPGGALWPWRDEQLAVTNVQGAVVGTGGTWGCAGFGHCHARVHLVVWRRMGACGCSGARSPSPITRQVGHPDGRHGVSAGFTAPGAGA